MATSDIGRARGTDYFLIRDQLTDAELGLPAPHPRSSSTTRSCPVINDYWERAEFPFELDREAGQARHRRGRHRGLRLPADEPDRRRSDPHGAQPRRRQRRHLPRRALRAGHALDRDARLRGAEAAVAAADGPAGEDRRVRAHRADHGSDSVALESSARRDGDDLGHQRRRSGGSATAPSPTSSWSGPATPPTGKVKGFLVEKGTPGYQASRHRGQGVAARGVERRHRADRLPGPGGEPAARGPVVQGRRPRCSPAPATPWPGRRSGHAVAAYEIALTYAQQRTQFGKPLVGFQMVQEKLVDDARRGHGHAAVLPAAGPAHRGGPVHRHDRGAGQAEQHRARPARSAAPPGRSSAATASCSTTTSCGTWPTWRRSTPTRGQQRSRR